MKKVRGRIKAGQGTLIGNAGEYYVVAELLKRGIVAALAPRNAPGFDVLATRGEATVRIRVKTKSEGYDVWQWVAKPDGTIFRVLYDLHDFTVLVNLSEKTRDLEFFVVPTPIIHDWLVARFRGWLERPGRNNRPHSPTNKKRHLSIREHAVQLEPYRDNWDILWQYGSSLKQGPQNVAALDPGVGLPSRDST